MSSESWVPVADFPGWLVKSSYMYKQGKSRLRSCANCRRRKIACSGPDRESHQCKQCKKRESLDCKYTLTDTEMEKFNAIKSVDGLNEACKKIGLKFQRGLNREDVVLPMEIRRLKLPSFTLCSMLIDYMCRLPLPFHHLSGKLFEHLWPRNPIVVYAAAFHCLTVYMPPLGEELQKMYPGLVELQGQEVEGYLNDLQTHVEGYLNGHRVDWEYCVIFTLYAVGLLHRGIRVGETEALAKSARMVYDGIAESDALNHPGLKIYTMESWIHVEALRSSIWYIQVALTQFSITTGRVLDLLPWKVIKHVPMVISEGEYDQVEMYHGLMDGRLTGVNFTQEEWERCFTLGFLQLPRGLEREKAWKYHIDEMEMRCPWNLYALACQILVRSCRGRLDDGLWEGIRMSDLQDVGEGVSVEEFCSPLYWSDVLDDVFRHMPLEVLQADGEGRGDLLFQYSVKMWGKGYGMRLVVVMNMLHEARMGCILRNMPPRDIRHNSDSTEEFVVDMFNSGSDEDLMALLREAMLISRNFGSLLKINPTLSGVVLAPFPQLLRVGFIHLAIARRLQSHGYRGAVVDDSEADAKVTLRVLEILGVRAMWVKKQAEIFKSILESGREPTMKDLGSMWFGGFGYLKR